MRSVVLWVIFLLLFSMSVMAQSESHASVYGGYQFLHLGAAGNSTNANGWNAAITVNAIKGLGVTGDFSGGYKSINGASGHVYTYTFGPTYSFAVSSKTTPFVHALFGGASASGSISSVGSASARGFAMYIGGGVDFNLKRSIAIRPVQFDWLHYSVSGVSGSSNVRICPGVVFHF